MRLSKFWWFTEDDGQICFASEPNTLAGYVVATGIVSTSSIKRHLTSEESVRLRDKSGCADDWIFTSEGSDAVIALAAEVFYEKPR